MHTYLTHICFEYHIRYWHNYLLLYFCFTPVQICGSSTKPYRVRTSPAVPKKRKPDAVPPGSYAKPTVASQIRSLSPYTHRRMCQLSEETRQRLGHFKLGPYIFKKETAPQAPFVVGNVEGLMGILTDDHDVCFSLI